MTRRTRWIVAFTLLVLLALGGVIWVRKHSAPEVARLLPQKIEGVIYVNLQPVRLATRFDQKPAQHDPEYDDFIRETGFVFERDLDEVAIAIHPPEEGPDQERRFSEVFRGRYDAARLTHYLHKVATSVERYRNVDIFLIPHEGRTVRVALLSVDAVAVSNVKDGSVISEMIDSYEKAAFPLRGPWLLRANYSHVPAASLAWAILAIDSPDKHRRSLPLPGGINFTIPEDTVTVASLRYLGSVQFKAEAFTKSEKATDSLFDNANTLLTLFRAIQGSMETGGPDQDVKAFFESLRLEKGDRRVTLTADVSPGFLRKAVTDAPATVTGAPEPSAAPVQAPQSGTKKPAR